MPLPVEVAAVAEAVAVAVVEAVRHPAVRPRILHLARPLRLARGPPAIPQRRPQPPPLQAWPSQWCRVPAAATVAAVAAGGGAAARAAAARAIVHGPTYGAARSLWQLAGDLLGEGGWPLLPW